MLYGTAAGLTATGSQSWAQDTGGVADIAETGDGFGATLAIGDLNNAAGHDLAIGAPTEDVGSVIDAGLVHVLYGTAAGVTATGSQVWSQNSAGVGDSVETGDGFGGSLGSG